MAVGWKLSCETEGMYYATWVFSRIWYTGISGLELCAGSYHLKCCPPKRTGVTCGNLVLVGIDALELQAFNPLHGKPVAGTGWNMIKVG